VELAESVVSNVSSWHLKMVLLSDEVTVCWLTICVCRATFFLADDNVA
jgi:hypothetical protein